ncbi:hypothetical protein HMI55_004417 [Coelomomyces lativittatus]|nr:hypothetical protein HMI55_004417 [Coelomomyces lativittatus]
METFLMTEKRWMSNWVLLANLTVDEFFQLRQRPFVLTVAIDSPLTLRCQRATLPNVR